jgi:dTDP-4-dehydrorhamnose reductase
MKVAIIGSNGQLGTDLMKVLGREYEAIGLTHKDIEVTDYNSCKILKEYNPNIVINTAAFHKTDQCEEEPLKAFLVNAIGAKNVATLSKDIDAITIFISTDYVFDGSKMEPYTEEDPPNPINTYGISKLAGELYTKQNPKHYIIRVASLFGVAGASGKGGNFIETMIAKARKNEPIAVVDDMWMSPTYTKDAAKAIKKMIELNVPYGTYHVTNSGYCTWYQFAQEIFRLAHLTPILTPIKTDQLQMKASRPKFSALKSINLPKYGIEMGEWKSALYDYLIEKGHIKV